MRPAGGNEVALDTDADLGLTCTEPGAAARREERRIRHLGHAEIARTARPRDGFAPLGDRRSGVVDPPQPPAAIRCRWPVGLLC